jgi:hypothetical protein
MLTIIIFTNGRYEYLFSLLNDIKGLKIKIWIIDYSKNHNKKNLYSSFKKEKFRIIKNDKSKTFDQRFWKYLKLVKTKYAWFIGDDDRIEKKYLNKLLNFITNKDVCGFTLGYKSFKKNYEIKYHKINKEIESKKFNILNNIQDLGMMSSQIINIKYTKKIFRILKNKILINNGYPHLYVIINLINNFDNWININNIIVYYRYGNINFNKKNLINRLNFEFRGYILPLKEVFDYFYIKKIYKKIFFKNIISWLILCKLKVGKKETSRVLKKNKDIIPFIWYINLLIKIILFTPNQILIFFKIVKKIYFTKNLYLKIT